MTQSMQLARHRCVCGRLVPVVRTTGLYEFAWQCACGSAGLISWAHAFDPPLYEVEPFSLFPEVRADAGITDVG
jgi:hypothetical protein